MFYNIFPWIIYFCLNETNIHIILSVLFNYAFSTFSIVYLSIILSLKHWRVVDIEAGDGNFVTIDVDMKNIRV